jgi:DNA repair ATPase RecN
VIGLYEFAAAAPSMTNALLDLRAHIVDAIKIDRDGSVFESKGKMERNAGFIRKYQQQVQRIEELAESMKKHQDRLTVLQTQLKEHLEVVKDREEQKKEVTKKLLGERAQTAELLRQLATLQKQVFQAKLDLITAHRENLKLEGEIGRWEGHKGGKAP